MKKQIIGIYEIGYERVQVVFRAGLGGEFYLCPRDGKIPRIVIGADQDRWSEVVTVLLHEAMEMIILRVGGRYKPTNRIMSDHGCYLFCFDHDQFSDACARVGEFMASALPEVGTAWKKWKRKTAGNK